MKLPHRHPSAGKPSSAPAPQEPAPAAAALPEQNTNAPGLLEVFRAAFAKPWLAGLLLVAAILLAYQSAWQAGYIWDDDYYVTRNPLLTAPDGLKRIWFSSDSPSQYFPLVYTMFRFERKLWDLDPAGYHWVNLLLHAANAVLLWRLLARLRVPGAWLAAAIFALHPVQVESVAWITERKNVLCLFFSLLSMRYWLKFTEAEPRPRWGFYALALLGALLALCSKTTACTLPAAFLLVLWLQGKPLGRERWAQLVPFLALGVAFGLVSVWWEQFHQGVKGNLLEFGPLHRLLIASRALWFYIGKLFWPANLSFSYPRWAVQPANPLAYLWLLAGGALSAAIVFARRFVGRGLEVAVLFYAATLSPLLGFFMLSTFRYSFVADHYQYVASIGPLALAAAGLTKALQLTEKATPWFRPAVCGLLLLALGCLTWTQAGAYANSAALWRMTVAHSPGSFMAQNNLAIELMARGDLNGAILHYRKALALEPDEAMIANNLGDTLLQKGQLDEAIGLFRRAIALQPRGSLYCNSLAGALFRHGELDEAIEWYRKALELQPDAPGVAGALGSALLQKGRPDEALSYLEQAARASPDSARAHSNLGIALGRAGRLREAVMHYEAAITLQPTNPITLNNLAWLLATGSDPSVRDGARAVELARQANRLYGASSPQILRTLATAYAEAGRFSEAVTTAQEALSLPGVTNDPAYAEAIRSQLKLFQEHLPYHDGGLTNSNRPALPAKP